MPAPNFTKGLDSYALLDSDSDEARGFTTYLGYWDCLDRAITREYGTDPLPVSVADLAGRPEFEKLAHRRYAGSPRDLQALLLNG